MSNEDKKSCMYVVESTNEAMGYNITMEDIKKVPRLLNYNQLYKELYFVSSEFFEENEIIFPRVPTNYFILNHYEDYLTPRICFGRSINDCLMSLAKDLKNEKLYVYNISEDSDITSPLVAPIHIVPDYEITHEIWVTNPIKLNCIGRIEVKDSTGEGYEYKYGNNSIGIYPKLLLKKSERNNAPLQFIKSGNNYSAKLYNWNYEWNYKNRK